MASKEKELEEWLREVGARLASPPSDVDELIALLDQTESFLLRVEQSPSQSISNAIRPAMTALVSRGFMDHSDKDVKVGLASCISEITRITAPDAPYDDNLMKEIFERFVETFERLDDVSSRSFSKKVAILETLAKVRSCVVMLDLECDALILKMFQHFFKTIRPGNARMVFSPMETIMVLVLEESEDISPELISCLLESVKIDNKDILPVARELGEKVISSCASKIKPYLGEMFQSMNFQGYSSVVASICQNAPDVLEQNDMAAPDDIMDDDSKQSEQTISDELHKGSGKVDQEVDCAEAAIQENLPEQGMNNDGNMVNDNSAVEPSSPKQKSERSRRGGTHRKTSAVEKKDSNSLGPVDEDPNSISVPVAKKVKGIPVSSSNSLNKEHDDHSLVDGTPANDVEACSGNELKNPVVADNGTFKVSLSTEAGTPNTIQRKRGRPSSKLSSKKGGGSGVNEHKSSTLQKGNKMNDKASSSRSDSKEHGDALDPEQKPLVHDGEKGPNSAVAVAEVPLDATSPLEDKSPKQSSKKASISKASKGMSSLKQKSSSKQHDKPTTEKDGNGEPSLKEIMSSGKKAHKAQGLAEENAKSSTKRARGAEESPETPAQHKELDESFVGSRIKVWWPDDKRYYQGTVETYNPSTKKHKILYDDGDIEILLLKKERWILVDEDHKKGQANDNSILDASSEEPQSKRTKTSTSSAKEHNRGTESHPPKRKGRPPKGISLAEDKPNDSRKVIEKFTTKKDAGTKFSIAEDIPRDSSKAIGKSDTKKDAGTESSLAEDIPSDLSKAIRKSGTKKDAGTKSILAEDPSDLRKVIGRSATKKDAGTKSSLSEDIPSDSSKAIGKSATKKDAVTKSSLAVDAPSDSSKAIGKSATKKDAGTKSSLAGDAPSDSSKAIGKSATKKDAGTKSSLAEDVPSDSSKAVAKSSTKKDAITKASLAEDIPIDSSKAIRKSATKKDAVTKSRLAEDSPSDSGKAIGNSATKKDAGTKSSLAEDGPSDSGKATSQSGTKKDAATKSKTGIRFNDDAENTPEGNSKTKDDVGSKARKELLKGKLNKDRPSSDRKPKISGSLRTKESKNSEA